MYSGVPITVFVICLPEHNAFANPKSVTFNSYPLITMFYGFKSLNRQGITDELRLFHTLTEMPDKYNEYNALHQLN